MFEKIKLLKYKLESMSIEVKASFSYTFASLLAKGIGIITIPIFTRILSTSEMGLVTVYMAWFSMLSVIASFGVDSGSFNIAMVEYKDSRSQYMSSALFFSTLSCVLLSIIFIIFRKFFVQTMGIPIHLLELMFFGFLVSPALHMWMGRQRYEYKYKSVVLISILSTILASTIAIGSVYYYSKTKNVNLGIIRLFSNNSVMYGLAFIFYIYVFIKGKKLFSRKYFKFILTVSSPLIIHTLAKQILDVSDRTMIAALVGKDAVGIYGVLYSISMLSLIFWNAINSSIIPFMFNNLEKSSQKEASIDKLVQPLLFFYALVCVVLTICSPEIVRIVATKEYYEAIYLMPPITAGIFFTALYNVFSNVLLYYKKTSFIMFSTIIAAVVNIVLNYILIPKFGYVAAAYTTLLTYILLAFMQYIFMNKVRKNKKLFDMKKIVATAVLTVLLCLLCNVLYLNPYLRYGFIIIFTLIIIVNRKKIKRILLSVVKK